MDPQRFDTLAKTLAAPGTRRSALAALLTGSLSLLGLQSTEGRKRHGGGGDVTIEGPCGDGSGADNRCRKPEQCCTGICERSRPGKPKRCRCRRKGQDCTETRNCCRGAGQNLVCDGQTCQPRCAGVTCTPLDECHEAGTCDPATGECSNPEKADGADCSAGHCCAGVCHECCIDEDCPSGFCHGSHVCAPKECTADSCTVASGEPICGRDANTHRQCECYKRADDTGLFCASEAIAGSDCASCGSGQTCVELHLPQCGNAQVCAKPCNWPT